MINDARTIVNRFPIRRSEWDRFKHGKLWFFNVFKNEGGRSPLCLDVGSGARPFPQANVLCDLYLTATRYGKWSPHREVKELRTEGKPFVLCDAHFLPFRTQSFNFVTAYYLLEHVDNPKRIFAELKRVAKHGYIQSPSWFNEEIMYGEPVHRWVVMVRNGKLFYRPVWRSLRPILPFGYISYRLYKRFFFWQLIHVILDELLNLFSTKYCF